MKALKNKLLRGSIMEKIVTEIFDEIDKLLDKNVIMIPFQDGRLKLCFERTLEVDLSELKNEILSKYTTE